MKKWLAIWYRQRRRFWFLRRGIDFAIFDNDDTLNDLFPIFLRVVGECDAFLANLLPPAQHAVVKKRLREINDHYFLQLSVNPRRWSFIFQDLLREFGLFTEERYRYLLQTVGRVYQTAPPLKAGAREVLSAWSDVRPLGLVTHANLVWHRLKMAQADIAHFFRYQQVVDEDKHKDAAAWQQVLDAWRLDAARVLVVEDNLRSLRDLSGLGVRHLIWLDEGSGWSVYREGELPSGLMVIGDLRELLRPWRLEPKERR